MLLGADYMGSNDAVTADRDLVREEHRNSSVSNVAILL
jgi:hypothetical protein